ncbi:hypothetical protein CGC20_18215 [Leishmania donovani]|uniref:Uncharacterized protein n=1 Tax=Leishmania donovani TaxID=5661 RepID=A0A504XRF3_LEIDO|nr:hypothetical protein CGC20_18215 [Leishmania donovani]
MSLRQHLFNQREVVAVFLDLGDATVHITDVALPAPHSALAPLGGAAASAHVPPLTRLDVVREALVAFVRAKVLFVPRTALLTFRLYVVRAGGATGKGHENGEAVVQELSALGPAGATGGRAMQTAIKALDPSLRGPNNSCESGAASSLPTVYTGVVRCLKRLLEEAEQAQRQPADQAVMWMSESASVTVLENSSFAYTKGPPAATASSNNAGLPSASPTRGGPPATAAAVNQEVCAVMHGIVLRSRHQGFDNFVQRGLHSYHCGATLAAATGIPHERAPPLSTELSIDDSCACALLDPVELTDAGPASLLSRAAFNAGDGTTSQKRRSTSYMLYVPAAEVITGTTAEKNITSQLAPSPKPSVPSASSRRSEFPPVLAMRAGNGSTSAQSWCVCAPVGTTRHSLLDMPLEIDLAMERHGSTTADEVPSQSPESSTKLPTLQLNRAATYDVCTQGRRAQAALSPSGRGPKKGPPRPQPQPPHQRPLNSGVRSGNVMLSNAQVPSTSAAAAHQQSTAFPVLAPFVTPLPLTHPHPFLSTQSGRVTARRVNGARANPGTQATDPSSGGGSDGSRRPSTAVSSGTSSKSTPLGTMAKGSASPPSHPQSPVK